MTDEEFSAAFFAGNLPGLLPYHRQLAEARELIAEVRRLRAKLAVVDEYYAAREAWQGTPHGDGTGEVGRAYDAACERIRVAMIRMYEAWQGTPRGAYKPDWHPSPDALRAWQAESAAHFAGLRAAGLREEMATVTDRLQRLEAIATQARALLDALPRCEMEEDGVPCRGVGAYLYSVYGGQAACEKHRGVWEPKPFAAPADALAKLLDELEGK